MGGGSYFNCNAVFCPSFMELTLIYIIRVNINPVNATSDGYY